MYDNLVFAKPIESIRCTDAQAATSAALNFTVRSHICSLKDLTVLSDASIKNGSVRKITKLGFEYFCKFLGIPQPFAQLIPVELLITNINKLIQTYRDVKVFLLERPDGCLTAIAKPKCKNIQYSDLVASFVESEKFKYVDMNEELFTLCNTFNKHTFSELPDESGVFSQLILSTYVYASAGAFSRLRMYSGLYRTECDNSLVAPFFGKAYANYQLDPDMILVEFTKLIQCYDSDVYHTLMERIPQLQKRLMHDYEFLKLWLTIYRILGSSVADSILEVSEEERQIEIKTVQERLSYNKRAVLVGNGLIPSVVTVRNAYTVLNRITSYGKELSGLSKYKIERLGGDFLKQLVFN